MARIEHHTIGERQIQQEQESARRAERRVERWNAIRGAIDTFIASPSALLLQSLMLGIGIGIVLFCAVVAVRLALKF